MKHLKIEYTTAAGKKIVLFDADVAEVVWNDSDDNVTVTGRFKKQTGNFFELLADAAKNKTESEAEAKREELKAEKVKATAE
jgi:hypothetical protein